MLDINLIRKDKDLVMKSVKDRGMKFNIDELLDTDNKKRKLQSKAEELRAKQNKASDKIAKLSDKEKQKAILDAKGTSERLKDLESQLSQVNKKYQELINELPNIPLSDVPIGRDDAENKLIKEEGQPTEFDFKPQDHMALAESLNLIDMKHAAKVSGARFDYLLNQVVLLEFALVRFAMDELTKQGFTPVIPPVIVNEKAMSAMGFLSQVEGREVYKILDPDDPKKFKYLIGTAEQSIGPMYMDEVLTEKELPKRYAGFSTCFRRESGSYGKDTHGIIRVHQFDKVEMFSFCKPDQDKKEFELLLSTFEKIIQALKIPYRLVNVCTGDLGFSKAKTVDLEAWIPSQKKYRELGSCSTCTDFQARRLKTKYRDAKSNKNEFVHTLNSTAVAMPRTLVAIMENYQQKNGSIKVPEVLWGYCGIKEIKKES